jgi:hypothetical protein
MSNSTADYLLPQITGAPNWDNALVNAPPVNTEVPAHLPSEPSTLSQGLIGIGILAAYGVMKRWPRKAATTAAARGTKAGNTTRRAA